MLKQQEKHIKQSEKRSFLGPCALKFAAANTGTQRIRKPIVDASGCIACGICASFCPAGLINVDKESDSKVGIDYRYCKGCGICANECSRRCISMVPERSDD